MKILIICLIFSFYRYWRVFEKYTFKMKVKYSVTSSTLSRSWNLSMRQIYYMFYRHSKFLFLSFILNLPINIHYLELIAINLDTTILFGQTWLPFSNYSNLHRLVEVSLKKKKHTDWEINVQFPTIPTLPKIFAISLKNYRPFGKRNNILQLPRL